MILYVDINDFIVDVAQKNLLAHAMIATGVVVITENYLFRDIRNYDIDDRIAIKQMVSIWGDKLKYAEGLHLLKESNMSSKSNPLFTALAETKSYMNQVDDTIDTIIDSFDRRSMDVRNLTIDEMFDDQSIELSKRYIEIYDLYRKSPIFNGGREEDVWGYIWLITSAYKARKTIFINNTDRFRIEKIWKKMIFHIKYGLPHSTQLSSIRNITDMESYRHLCINEKISDIKNITDVDTYCYILTSTLNAEIRKNPFMYFILLDEAAMFCKNNQCTIDSGDFIFIMDELKYSYHDTTKIFNDTINWSTAFISNHAFEYNMMVNRDEYDDYYKINHDMDCEVKNE